jgi:quercetin dioxygenase-like cupin family protein
VSAGLRVLVTGEDTAGRFAAVEFGTAPGSEPPLHRHTREDELVYVLEGEVVFHLDGERFCCGPQGRLFLPRGREHTLAVQSEGARLLVLLIPAGFERYFREMDDPGGASQGAAPDFERLVTVAARYGVEITGPPPGKDDDRRRPVEEHGQQSPAQE